MIDVCFSTKTKDYNGQLGCLNIFVTIGSIRSINQCCINVLKYDCGMFNKHALFNLNGIWSCLFNNSFEVLFVFVRL